MKSTKKETFATFKTIRLILVLPVVLFMEILEWFYGIIMYDEKLIIKIKDRK